MIRPPASIAALVAAAGEEAVMRLVEGHGGRRITVAARAAGSKIAQLYGTEIAEALFKQYGHEAFKVPLARAWRAQVYRASGLTVADIGRHLGASRSAVQRLLAKMEVEDTPSRTPGLVTFRTDPNQIDMFEDS